jgi:hypothetical protein
MYKTTLVRTDIERGERVVSALEASGLKITAAFWWNKEDEDDWYLVVVSPDVAEKGPTQVYRQAFELLNNGDVDPPEPFDSWWGRVKIISPVTLIYRNLKQRAGTGDGPVRPGWALDSYIYKME